MYDMYILYMYVSIDCIMYVWVYVSKVSHKSVFVEAVYNNVKCHFQLQADIK